MHQRLTQRRGGSRIRPWTGGFDHRQICQEAFLPSTRSSWGSSLSELLRRRSRPRDFSMFLRRYLSRSRTSRPSRAACRGHWTRSGLYRGRIGCRILILASSKTGHLGSPMRDWMTKSPGARLCLTRTQSSEGRKRKIKEYDFRLRGSPAVMTAYAVR